MCSTYPQPVLHLDVAAVEDGGIHIMGDGDDPCDPFICRWKDRLSHLFKDVFSIKSSLPTCEEAMLSVHAILGLDFMRRVVHNASRNL